MKGNHLSNIPDPERKMTNLEGLNGTHVRDIVKSRKGETGQGEGATTVNERQQVLEQERRLPEEVHKPNLYRVACAIAAMGKSDEVIKTLISIIKSGLDNTSQRNDDFGLLFGDIFIDVDEPDAR